VRRAGLDSGSRWVAIMIADGNTAPFAHVHAEAIEVGRVVPIEPVTKTRKDGSTYTLTERHEVTVDDEKRAADAVMLALTRHAIDHLTIEMVSNFYVERGASAQRASAQGTLTIRAERIATRVAERCERMGIAVEYVARATARAKVGGRGSRGGDGAERIRGAVEERVRGLPRITGEAADHIRDAAVAMLWGALPEEDRSARKRSKRDPKSTEKAPPKKRSRAKYPPGQRPKPGLRFIAGACGCDPDWGHTGGPLCPPQCPACKRRGRCRGDCPSPMVAIEKSSTPS